MKFLIRCFAVILSALLVSGCSSGNGGFPQIANPPPFDFADGEELRSGMHQLAFELQRLDAALMAQEMQDSFSQTEVVDSLRNIERIAGQLREGDMSSRHTFLRDDMASFLSTVSRARMNAEANPGRLYMAGRVSGACVNCHRANQ